MDNGYDWKLLAARLFCLLTAIFGAYIFFKYLLAVFLPFLIAFAAAIPVIRLSEKISSFTRIPKSICAFFIDTLLTVTLGGAIFVIFRHLAYEIARIPELCSAVNADSLKTAFSPLEGAPLVGNVLAFAEKVLGGEVTAFVGNILPSLVGTVGTLAGKLLLGSPRVFFSCLVAVLSFYYISMDNGKLRNFIFSLLPSKYTEHMKEIKNSAFFVLARYFHAYAKLFLLTFAETLTGLLIIRCRFAVFGAFIVAAIDILPVFGAGFVLIPWGAICLFTGDFFAGVGLLLTYITVTVVRRIAEPKIIGDSVGLHPFAALVGVFAGFYLFGTLGMLFAPAVIAVLLNFLHSSEH